MANLIFSKLLPFSPVRFSSRFLVSMNFSPCNVTTHQYCFFMSAHGNKQRPTYSYDQEFEGHAMRAGGLVLEMEAVDKVLIRCFCLLWRHPLRDKTSVLIDADDRVFACHLPVKLVVVDLEYSDLACFALFW